MLYAIFKASHPPWSHWGRSACPLTLRANPMCLCTENPTLTFHLRDLNLQKNLSCWCCRVDKNLLHLFVGHRTTSSKHLVAHFFPAPKSLTTKRSPLCSFGLHPRPASVRWKTPCYVVYTLVGKAWPCCSKRQRIFNKNTSSSLIKLLLRTEF